MSEEALITDDQSHYEVSLTAGQAFLAFVLLLLSLAASFAFGLLIGRGQADERLTARKEATVVNEAGAAPAKQSVKPEVPVRDDDFKQSPASAKINEEASQDAQQAPAVPTPVTPAAERAAEPVKPVTKPAPKPATIARPAPVETAPAKPAAEYGVPYYAQIVSSSDQKTAEALAAKVIDGGFTSAYVERVFTTKGNAFRVRIKFASEAEARAAEPKLKTFSKDVWITR
ncbi:MAG TPA: SPOR domain-containing protein [Thermoanaerobaculia bacterium]